MGSAASRPVDKELRVPQQQRENLAIKSSTKDSPECEGGSCPVKQPGSSTLLINSTMSNNSDTTPHATTDESAAGGCPMKRGDGTYSYSWWSVLKAPASHQQQQHEQPNQDQQNHKSLPQYNVYSQPIDPNNKMPVAQARHQMPAPTQTVPLSTERVSSSIPKGGGDTTSNSSTTTNTTWLYPSPQMFYNALVRKQKVNQDDDEEEQQQVEMMVQLHNAMNEKTWQDVLQWEALHHQTNRSDDTTNHSSKLLKFQGRPNDTSPKALIKHYLFQQPLPFDRHDWIVVRNDGSNKTIRYVIDYYYNDQGTSVLKHSDKDASVNANAAANASGNDKDKSILLVDVRPALDSLEALWDRVVSMPYARFVRKSTPFTPLPLAALTTPTAKPSSELQQQVRDSSARVAIWQSMIQQQKEQTGAANASSTITQTPTISDQQATRLALQLSQVLKQCQQAQTMLDKCNADDTEAMQQATMQLTMCMAQVVCPLQHDALMKCILDDNGADDDSNDVKVEVALDTTSACVSNFFQKVQVAQTQHHQVFENARGAKK